MAKKKKANSKAPTKAPDDILYDRMPGADPIEESKFEVDMSFDMPKDAEEDVIFPEPEGETVEEAEETETVASGDEVAPQESTEEPEAETKVEAEESGDSASEETVEAASGDDVSSDDEGAEGETEEPVVKKSKAPMVPKTRLDEVLAKNKAMQKKIKAYETQEAQKAEAPQYDFSTKESEYQQLVLDGEAEKASALRADIRNAEKAQIMFEVNTQMGQTVQQNQEEQELIAKAQEIEATFSILDEKSTDFNEALTQEVMELRDAFIIQGYGAADSLARATEYTLAVKHPELLKGKPESSNGTGLKQKKQKTTVKKKIAASKAQPPAMRGEGAGERGDKAVNLNVLSESEFAALPEETIKRLRGDFG